MKVKSESEVAQSCLTLSDAIDCSPPGSPIHGIFQARVLEWVAIAFSLKVLGTAIREEKEIKENRKEVKFSQFADDMILCIKNPKDTTRKLLELINEYSKATEYKTNKQKSFAFLNTNNEKTEREIKETILFTISMKRIKYLGINLPKETKDLYIENYKTLMKEIKDDTNRQRNIPCSLEE